MCIWTVIVYMQVSLPTFILEKRSHLEMYADLFSHPDLFLAINDAPTPEARMIATVQFYLTTFHAGRNVSYFCQTLISNSVMFSLMWQRSHTIQYWVKCFVAMSMLPECHQGCH